MYVFVGTSDYLPSTDKWLLYIYSIILANTLRERYSLTKQTVKHRYCAHVSMKVSKDAKIRNRYNQKPHLAQDTNGKVTNSQLDTTNESQEVSPFQAGDHKAHINRGAQGHSKHKTEQKHKRSTKEVPPWNGQ